MGSMNGIGFFKREHLISLDNYEYRKEFFFFFFTSFGNLTFDILFVQRDHNGF